MTGALSAAKRALGVVVGNPAFVAVGLVAGLAFGVAALVLSLVPFVGPLVVNVVLLPLLLGGLLGMALAGIRGSASVADFTGAVSEHATNLVGAYAILNGATVVAVVGVAVLVAVVGAVTVGLGGVSTGDPGAVAGSLASGTGLAVVALLVVVLLGFALVGVVFQFLGAAVVVGGESATGAFGACWRLFRQHPLSVVGFSVLLVASFLLLAGAASVVSVAGLGSLETGFLGAVLAVGFWFPFSVAYQAAFYDAVAPGGDVGSEPDAGAGG